MLYLKQPADPAAAGPERRVAVSEETAFRLERALLTGNCAARRQVLFAALTDDREVAGWALRAAELRLHRTINRIDDAADWLSGCLETELADWLLVDESSVNPGNFEWRLAALAKKTAAYEQSLSDFNRRLEHEKLESLKELAYGASHEINNPLANIASRAQTLLDDESDPERRRKLSTIHRQAMRAHEMISDLMLFARPPKLKLARCGVQLLVNRIVDELRDFALENGVELQCEAGSEPIEVLADETQIGVALQAVLKNALEAGGGHVGVTVLRQQIGGEHRAQICVRDDGPGIPDQVRQHIFDPFFSGREAGRGLGFGLSKCWRIVTGHGGEVVVQRAAGGGTEVSILLPLASSSFSPEPTATEVFQTPSPLAPG